MNVVIYARFSSHSQTEQSIEGQLKVCYEYAEANHYTVCLLYTSNTMFFSKLDCPALKACCGY